MDSVGFQRHPDPFAMQHLLFANPVLSIGIRTEQLLRHDVNIGKQGKIQTRVILCVEFGNLLIFSKNVLFRHKIPKGRNKGQTQCRLFRGKRGQPAGLALAAAVGAFTNTVLVMGLIYLVFREAYAAVNGISETAVLTAILGVVGTNGVPEAIAAAVITPAVVLPLQRILGRNQTKHGA